MMASITHRQMAYRQPAGRPSGYRWPERTLQDQRHPCNATPGKRADCSQKTEKSRTLHDQYRALTKCWLNLLEMAECFSRSQRGMIRRLDDACKEISRRMKVAATAGFSKFGERQHFNNISAICGMDIRDGHLHILGFDRMDVRHKGGNRYPYGKPMSAFPDLPALESGIGPADGASNAHKTCSVRFSGSEWERARTDTERKRPPAAMFVRNWITASIHSGASAISSPIPAHQHPGSGALPAIPASAEPSGADAWMRPGNRPSNR